jgi:hypothetical protein
MNYYNYSQQQYPRQQQYNTQRPSRQEYYDPRRETVGPLGNLPTANVYTTPTKKRRSSNDSVKTIRISPEKKRKTPKKDKNKEKIKNWKPDDGWVKQGKSRQDKISEDSKEFLKRFEGYSEIKHEEYSLIPEGTWIRYMKYEPGTKFGFKYRSGGLLARNSYPDYWVLKPLGGRGKNWSVPLKSKNRYFKKDRKEEKKIKDKKDKLYHAINDGKYVLLSIDDYKRLTAK